MVGKPEGKRLHGRPRRRWENNINMDLQEVGPIKFREFLTSCKPVSFSIMTLLHGVSK
jgi:hypothetical protein